MLILQRNKTEWSTIALVKYFNSSASFVLPLIFLL